MDARSEALTLITWLTWSNKSTFDLSTEYCAILEWSTTSFSSPEISVLIYLLSPTSFKPSGLSNVTTGIVPLYSGSFDKSL